GEAHVVKQHHKDVGCPTWGLGPRWPPGRRLLHRRADLALEHVIGQRIHSGLIPAALMIGHHFSISDFWKVASACGVCRSGGKISPPRSASRDRTVGSAKAAMIDAFSFSRTAPGVCFGAHIARQASM